MSAHVDKTLHRKIYNINDADTFSSYPFFTNVIFVHEFMHKFMKEFFTNFMYEFKYEICTNSREFIQIHMSFFALKIGYVMNGLYCNNSTCTS